MGWQEAQIIYISLLYDCVVSVVYYLPRALPLNSIFVRKGGKYWNGNVDYKLIETKMFLKNELEIIGNLDLATILVEGVAGINWGVQNLPFYTVTKQTHMNSCVLIFSMFSILV